MPAPLPDLLLRRLGQVAYLPTFEAMRTYTQQRVPDSADEIWLCQHAPVYTQGLAGQAAHLLQPGAIPVVQTDRGGQVTYHGPGQLVAYPLLDLRRAGLYVKQYVHRLEEALLRTLAHLGVTGHRIAGAPGIYVRLADPFDHAALTGPRPAADPFAGLGKIAALGIKVHRHCSYHGLALNVAMDLEPFARINPCGYAGLQTVDLSTIGVAIEVAEVEPLLLRHLVALLGP
ncbi:MAG: lipoyl(octanoyl) transferase LipB [Serpentinimonas sp.]|nr:lipoyl(octanoyl) transferase LipB [Serpentinimonas sp.]